MAILYCCLTPYVFHCDTPLDQVDMGWWSNIDTKWRLDLFFLKLWFEKTIWHAILFFCSICLLKCLPRVKVSQNVRVDFWVQHISVQASILLDFRHGAVLCYLSRQEPPHALKDVHCWHGLISKTHRAHWGLFVTRDVILLGWLQISLYIKLWTWTFSERVIQTTLQNVDTIPLIPTIWWHLPLLIWGPTIYPL